MLPFVLSTNLSWIAARVLMIVCCASGFVAAGFQVEAQEAVAGNAPAQEPADRLQGRISDKPILIGYARNVSPARMIDYVSNLTTQLKIGERFRDQLSSESQQERMEQTVLMVLQVHKVFKE